MIKHNVVPHINELTLAFYAIYFIGKYLLFEKHSATIFALKILLKTLNNICKDMTIETQTSHKLTFLKSSTECLIF